MLMMMLKAFEKSEGGGGSYHFTNKQLSGRETHFTLPAFYDDLDDIDDDDDDDDDDDGGDVEGI